MDGVPGLTQSPIRPGGDFTYAFTPPDAGTFWYHSHDHGLEQMGRGLVGAFIVDEPGPPEVDRELIWMVQDWRLTDDGKIVGGFGNSMEAAMAGRVGNRITINGRPREPVRVRAGERIRLRVLNAAVARIMSLSFEGHAPVLIARDGQPCEPQALDGGRLLLGPAMRADLILDMTGRPGERYAITDGFYGQDLSYRLVELAYADTAPLRDHPKDGSIRLAPNPLPQPDLPNAEHHPLRLQGGMMSTMGMGMGGSHAVWAINGVSMTGDGDPNMPPLFTTARGRTCVITFINETAWWHPMHLHGHSLRILSRNSQPATGAVWCDTVLVAQGETVEAAFVADNPGDWMLHCHVMDHQVAGLMTIIRVA
jgi:FtsP/CotA-like multicopper oxidase with cupredoxin domain